MVASCISCEVHWTPENHLLTITLMNATELAYRAEIEDASTPIETLRLWFAVETDAHDLAERSMRRAQSLKDEATRRKRWIKSALKKRGENV